MALASGFSMTLSNPISICLVLLGPVVMPVAVLVLPFNVDRHTPISRDREMGRYTQFHLTPLKNKDQYPCSQALTIDPNLWWQSVVISLFMTNSMSCLCSLWWMSGIDSQMSLIHVHDPVASFGDIIVSCWDETSRISIFGSCNSTLGECLNLGIKAFESEFSKRPVYTSLHKVASIETSQILGTEIEWRDTRGR
jgi:hypothetical protein